MTSPSLLKPRQRSAATSSTNIATAAVHHPHDKKKKKKKPWTDTNSDATCLPDGAGFLQRCLYVTNIHTALFMFNPRERFVCYLAAWILLAVTLVCAAVFGQGLRDGFAVAAATANSSEAEATVLRMAESL